MIGMTDAAPRDPEFRSGANVVALEPVIARRRLATLVSGRDLGPIIALTLTEGGARLLSFFFYVLAARALTPLGFGRVRYTLAIVLIAFFLLQVIVKAIARELGSARGDAEATRQLIGSSVALTTVMLVLTAGLCVVAGDARLLGPVDVTGLIVALVGYTTFQAYYAIARGIGETLRPAAAYVGGSVVQLVVFGALVLLAHPSPQTTLIVYGLSSLVPIAVCEARRPVIRTSLLPQAAAMRRLISTGLPLLAGQIAFIVWNSADQIWVQNRLGTRDIGLYGAARNLSQLFIVIPTGVGVALLPRLAELRARGDAERARKLALYCTGGVTGITAILAAIVILARSPLLGLLYGSSYRVAAVALLLQSLGMVFYSAFATLTGCAIGWGWPRLSVVGITVAAACEVLCLFALPGNHLATAGAAFAISIGMALAVVVIWGALRGKAHLDAGMTHDKTESRSL